MANPSKKKGTAWETEVATYLGLRRLPLAGSKDAGDLDHPAWVIECKAEKAITLSSYMDETSAEMENAGKDFGVAIVKRRGKNVAQGYAVMTVETFDRVLADLTYADLD